MEEKKKVNLKKQTKKTSSVSKNSETHMETKVRYKHDKFFTQTMSNIQLAREFLDKFLDSGVLDKIDLSTLEKLPDSHVTKKGKDYYTDALYSMKYDKNRDGLLYILIEHKSYRAHETAFQLLEYMGVIYQKYRKASNGKAPIVIPVVVYHGDKKWEYPLDFLEYIDLDIEKDRDLLQYVPNFRYRLYDFARMDIEERENYSHELKIFLLSLRIRSHKGKKTLRELLLELDKVSDKDWADKAFSYIVEFLTPREEEVLKEIYETEHLEDGGRLMTMTQSWLKRGIAEGREKGRSEGKFEGKIEEKLEIAKNLFKMGLDFNMISEATKLSIDEIKKAISKMN